GGLAVTGCAHGRAGAFRARARRWHAGPRAAPVVAHAGSETLRFYPHLKLARDDQSGGEALPGSTGDRRAHAGGCGPERGTFAGRRAGNGLRFPGLLRAQNVWTDWDRSALRTRGVA